MLLGPLFNAFAALECISAVFGYVRDTSPGSYLFPRACGIGCARDKASPSLTAIQCSSALQVPRVIPQVCDSAIRIPVQLRINNYSGLSYTHTHRNITDVNIT